MANFRRQIRQMTDLGGPSLLTTLSRFGRNSAASKITSEQYGFTVGTATTATTNCYANAWFAGNASSPSNANGAADGVFTDNTGNTSWYGQWDMEDPAAELGSRTQTVEVTCCVSESGGEAYLDSLDIYYNNVFKGSATLSGSNTVTSTTGQVVTFTFPGSWLPDTDLAQLGLYAVAYIGTVQVDSIKWIAAHDETVILTTINFSLNQSETWAAAADKLVYKELATALAETYAAATAAIGDRPVTAAITQSEDWLFSSPAKTKNIEAALAEAQTWVAELQRAKTLATTLTELETVTAEQKRTRAYTTLLPQIQAWDSKVTSSRETAKPISTTLAQAENVVTRAARLRPLVAALSQAQTILTSADKVFRLATVLAQVEAYAVELGRIKQGFSLSAQRQYTLATARRNRVAATTLSERETITPRNQRIRNVQTTLNQTVAILTDPVEHLQDQKLHGGVIWGSAQTPHLGVDVYRQSAKQEYVLGTAYVYLNDHYVYVRTAIAIAPRQECDILSEFIAFPGVGYAHDLEETAEPGNYIWIRAVDSPLH